MELNQRHIIYIGTVRPKTKQSPLFLSKTMQIQQKVFPTFGKKFHVYLMKGS